MKQANEGLLRLWLLSVSPAALRKFAQAVRQRAVELGIEPAEKPWTVHDGDPANVSSDEQGFIDWAWSIELPLNVPGSDQSKQADRERRLNVVREKNVEICAKCLATLKARGL